MELVFGLGAQHVTRSVSVRSKFTRVLIVDQLSDEQLAVEFQTISGEFRSRSTLQRLHTPPGKNQPGSR